MRLRRGDGGESMHYRNYGQTVQAEDTRDSSARLLAANVNPATGLATDYLNHFNEAIMLLEMLPDCPDCMGAFLDWRAKDYRAHFTDGGSQSGQVAIDAYANADPEARADLEVLAKMMTAVIETTRAAISAGMPAATAAVFASRAAASLKPLVARAGAVINGEPAMEAAASPQAAVDTLMRRRA
jgi:hypothetical protein